MRQLNVAVCDDEQIAVNTISGTVASFLHEYGIEADIKCFVSSKELVEYCERVQLDLVFLDIEMPEIDGIKLGNILRGLKETPEVVYVSNREDRVFDAIRIHPLGFVRKGHFIEDIGSVMKTWLEQRQNKWEEKKELVVACGSGYFKAPIATIMYFEGSGTYQMMYIKSQQEPLRIKSRMKQLEDELAEYDFLRIHKGYLVNYAFIKYINATDVLMENGKLLPISRGKVAEIKKEYLAISRKTGSMLF